MEVVTLQQAESHVGSKELGKRRERLQRGREIVLEEGVEPEEGLVVELQDGEVVEVEELCVDEGVDELVLRRELGRVQHVDDPRVVNLADDSVGHAVLGVLDKDRQLIVDRSVERENGDAVEAAAVAPFCSDFGGPPWELQALPAQDREEGRQAERVDGRQTFLVRSDRRQVVHAQVERLRRLRRGRAACRRRRPRRR